MCFCDKIMGMIAYNIPPSPSLSLPFAVCAIPLFSTLPRLGCGLQIIKRKFRVRADKYHMTGGTGSLRYMAPEVWFFAWVVAVSP